MNPVLHELEPGLSVCGQLSEDDVSRVAALGFRSLICNRPDHEEPAQPDAATLESAARRAGLEWASIPITSATLTDGQIDTFGVALDRLPRPILAYCRSGNRCCVLWALSRASNSPPAKLAEVAGEAGYDLTAWMPRLQARGMTG